MRLGSRAELADLGRPMGERLGDVGAVCAALPSLVEEFPGCDQWLQGGDAGADYGDVDFYHGPDVYLYPLLGMDGLLYMKGEKNLLVRRL